MFRLSILSRILPQVLGVFAFAALVVWISRLHPEPFRSLNVAPFTLLGIAVSIFLGFRNSACYDRWWEARRQLGALIGELRSLARLTLETPEGDRLRRERCVRHIIAYTHCLMASLRGDAPPTEAGEFALSGIPETARNVPDALLRTLAAEFGTMLREGEFTEILYTRFDERLSAVAAIQVACERIKSTPTPFSYTLLLHRTAYAFCFLLPFGLTSTFGYATPLFCAVVAYAFFGLDMLGDELQEPFSGGLNALPLSAMARTVEISMLEALGVPNPPTPLEPVDSILS